jgi:hypothetical protein
MGIEVRRAQFNLFQGNIDGSGQVRRSELGGSAHVHELRSASCRIPVLPSFDGDCLCCAWHSFPSIWEERLFAKKDSRARKNSSGRGELTASPALGPAGSRKPVQSNP